MPTRDLIRINTGTTGLLLLLRAVFFIMFSVNVFGDPAINLLAIATMMFILFIYVAVSKHVYKAKYLNVLERPFSSTWASLPQASLFTRLTTANQKALTCTSVGTVFVTFCTIVLYHTVIRITEFLQKYYYFQQITTRVDGLKQRINGH